jgi:hypothetical protein
MLLRPAAAYAQKTGEMEEFHSDKLKDDLPSEEELDGEIDVGDMGCGVDDY